MTRFYEEQRLVTVTVALRGASTKSIMALGEVLVG